MKRFIDTTTNELLDESFGVCERLFNCGYEKRPNTEKIATVSEYREPKKPFYFEAEVMNKTLNKYSNNALYGFLCSKFEFEKVRQTFERYKVGTSEWGDTIFWQVNQLGQIVAGKKIQYFSNGKRNKARGANWLHNKNGFNFDTHELAQVLFGSQLIDDATQKVYVVESEKTALICELVKRDKSTVFLATGGMQNLGLIAKIKTCAPIFCIPDNDCIKIWEDKIIRLGLNCKVEIIPALQEMELGADVGDFILKTKI